MGDNYKTEGDFSYLEAGEGTPIIILHGLMGNLSNFDGVFDFSGRCDLFRAGFIDGLDFVRDYVFYRIQGNVVLRVPEY